MDTRSRLLDITTTEEAQAILGAVAATFPELVPYQGEMIAGGLRAADGQLGLWIAAYPNFGGWCLSFRGAPERVAQLEAALDRLGRHVPLDDVLAELAPLARYDPARHPRLWIAARTGQGEDPRVTQIFRRFLRCEDAEVQESILWCVCGNLDYAAAMLPDLERLQAESHHHNVQIALEVVITEFRAHLAVHSPT